MKVEGVKMGHVYPIRDGAVGQGSHGKRVPTEGNIQASVKSMDQNYTQDQLMKAIERANKSFEPFDRRFEFTVHEKTKTIMVKVIDKSNDEVIREIPPEKILDMVAHMLEVAGIIVDKRG